MCLCRLNAVWSYICSREELGVFACIYVNLSMCYAISREKGVLGKSFVYF